MPGLSHSLDALLRLSRECAPPAFDFPCAAHYLVATRSNIRQPDAKKQQAEPSNESDSCKYGRHCSSSLIHYPIRLVANGLLPVPLGIRVG